MSILRSEDMGLYILSLEKSSSWEIMNSLGKLSCLQFIDSNAKEQVYRLPYSSMVFRCDETLKKIRFIEELCKLYNKPLKQSSSVETFLERLQHVIASYEMDSAAYFEVIEQEMGKTEKFLAYHQARAEAAFAKYTSIVEQKYVLEKAEDIIIGNKK